MDDRKVAESGAPKNSAEKPGINVGGAPLGILIPKNFRFELWDCQDGEEKIEVLGLEVLEDHGSGEIIVKGVKKTGQVSDFTSPPRRFIGIKRIGPQCVTKLMYLKLSKIYVLKNGIKAAGVVPLMQAMPEVDEAAGTITYAVFGLVPEEVNGVQKVPVGAKERDSKLTMEIKSRDGASMGRFVLWMLKEYKQDHHKVVTIEQGEE